jgi:hypothetical protein
MLLSTMQGRDQDPESKCRFSETDDDKFEEMVRIPKLIPFLLP